MIEKSVDLGIVLILLLGISLFQSIRSARGGNLTAALALLCAIAVIVQRHFLAPWGLLLLFLAVGAVAGWWLACRISMTGIPAMVALQNGMGGMASFLVSFVELMRGANSPATQPGQTAALLGIVVGAATFSGSLVAAGRLSHWLAQKPKVFRHHGRILAGLAVATLLIMILAVPSCSMGVLGVLGTVLICMATALGVVLSIRVGGADMPVLISFLNAGSGLAAALCGLSIGNWLLITAGAIVGVSGMILTQVMCRAMNRNLGSILTGGLAPQSVPASTPTESPAKSAAPAPAISSAPQAEPADPFAQAVDILRSARRIIVVPGYGMALAEAQEEVSRLADRLTGMEREVVFAVHPVAGRMPGHMHVLLAEAEVDYGMIRDLKDINAEFAKTDVALVVGACDVVNPAAMERAGTPISGMPILRVHEAKHVIVCNLDDRPGYSGVENPLYGHSHTIMLLGDAKLTVSRLIEGLA